MKFTLRNAIVIFIAVFIVWIGLSLSIMGKIVSALVCLFLILGAIRRSVLMLKAISLGPSADPVPLEEYPELTVFIPAHNEQAVIGNCLQSLAKVEYPSEKLQVVVIDDASDDDTAQIVLEHSDKLAGLKLFQRGKGVGGVGKPAALNAALEEFSSQHICYFLDADSIIAPDALKRAAAHLACSDVGAVTGRLEPENSAESFVAFYSALEVWTHHLATLWPASTLGLMCPVLGSNWAIRRETLNKYGLGEAQLLEDIEISVALANDGKKIHFDEKMQAQFRVPSTLKEYFFQHIGWGRGFSSIGQRHSGNIAKGAGNVVQKIDRLIYSWGYLDRPLLLLLVVMAFYNYFGSPEFYAPVWFIVLLLFLPILHMLAGLERAGQEQNAILKMIFIAPVMFLVDIAAAVTAFAFELFGLPRRWYKTGRGGSDQGKYMNLAEK